MNAIFKSKFAAICLSIALVTSTLIFTFFSSIDPVLAVSGDLAKQVPIEVKVKLGNENNEFKFFPNKFTFEAGKRYKLILENPSTTKHYFTAKDFADAIWTQKVDAGRVEVKGAVRELELRPGTQAEWVFIPLRSGEYSLRCTVAGHTEAGMTGSIAIVAAS